MSADTERFRKAPSLHQEAEGLWAPELESSRLSEQTCASLTGLLLTRQPLGLVSSSQIYCVCFCLKDIKAACFAHILELHIWGRLPDIHYIFSLNPVLHQVNDKTSHRAGRGRREALLPAGSGQRPPARPSFSAPHTHRITQHVGHTRARVHAGSPLLPLRLAVGQPALMGTFPGKALAGAGQTDGRGSCPSGGRGRGLLRTLPFHAGMMAARREREGACESAGCALPWIRAAESGRSDQPWHC